MTQIDLNQMGKYRKEEPVAEEKKPTFVSKHVKGFASFMGGYAIFSYILSKVVGILAPAIVLYMVWRLVFRHTLGM